MTIVGDVVVKLLTSYQGRSVRLNGVTGNGSAGRSSSAREAGKVAAVGCYSLKLGDRRRTDRQTGRREDDSSEVKKVEAAQVAVGCELAGGWLA